MLPAHDEPQGGPDQGPVGERHQQGAIGADRQEDGEGADMADGAHQPRAGQCAEQEAKEIGGADGADDPVGHAMGGEVERDEGGHHAERDLGDEDAHEHRHDCAETSGRGETSGHGGSCGSGGFGRLYAAPIVSVLRRSVGLSIFLYLDPVRIEGQVILDGLDCRERRLVGPDGVHAALAGIGQAEVGTIAFERAVGRMRGSGEPRHVDIGTRNVVDRGIFRFSQGQRAVRLIVGRIEDLNFSGR
jgi:hypothetical protein